MRLYDDPLSGNGYKVRLLLSHLGTPLALDVMEQRLAVNAFLASDRCSIADIALYAYTHLAHEGGIDLVRFPAIRTWLERVRHQPGHVRIDQWQGR